MLSPLFVKYNLYKIRCDYPAINANLLTSNAYFNLLYENDVEFYISSNQLEIIQLSKEIAHEDNKPYETNEELKPSAKKSTVVKVLPGDGVDLY
ncbi:hypothetical protein PROH_18450 [Prochlorothrix hollandica PCC 9006 = CALU 1027]|uniref:Uncharacterized protein n=1 Tax=Prochlorothrix hollandica PCC 9006 = CALU 1027 TaxID=317619 RepID=A0A0M2PUX1_PROHO|nr:hypothetical protein PROH_18450 [Prochlorothrix hollandica PCC 9006 = CALU 1027]